MERENHNYFLYPGHMSFPFRRHRSILINDTLTVRPTWKRIVYEISVRGSVDDNPEERMLSMPKTTRDSISRLLENCPDRVKKSGWTITPENGTRLFNQGEPPEHIAILTSGNLRSYYTSARGTRYYNSDKIPGDIIADIEILDGKPCACTVESIGGAVLFCLPKSGYERWILTDPDFNAYVHARLCDKVYEMLHKDSENILYPLRFRLLNYIRNMTDRNGKGNPVKVEKSILCEHLGVTYRSLNRTLRELSEKGVLEYQKGSLRIISEPDFSREYMKSWM